MRTSSQGGRGANAAVTAAEPPTLRELTAMFSPQPPTSLSARSLRCHPNAIGLQLFDRDGTRIMVSTLFSGRKSGPVGASRVLRFLSATPTTPDGRARIRTLWQRLGRCLAGSRTCKTAPTGFTGGSRGIPRICPLVRGARLTRSRALVEAAARTRGGQHPTIFEARSAHRENRRDFHL